jgi:hypothetical protein
MKRIRCCEKPGDCHDDQHDHQNQSQKSCARGLFLA